MYSKLQTTTARKGKHYYKEANGCLARGTNDSKTHSGGCVVLLNLLSLFDVAKLKQACQWDQPVTEHSVQHTTPRDVVKIIGEFATMQCADKITHACLIVFRVSCILIIKFITTIN